MNLNEYYRSTSEALRLPTGGEIKAGVRSAGKALVKEFGGYKGIIAGGLALAGVPELIRNVVKNIDTEDLDGGVALASLSKMGADFSGMDQVEARGFASKLSSLIKSLPDNIKAAHKKDVLIPILVILSRIKSEEYGGKSCYRVGNGHTDQDTLFKACFLNKKLLGKVGIPPANIKNFLRGLVAQTAPETRQEGKVLYSCNVNKDTIAAINAKGGKPESCVYLPDVLIPLFKFIKKEMKFVPVKGS